MCGGSPHVYNPYESVIEICHITHTYNDDMDDIYRFVSMDDIDDTYRFVSTDYTDDIYRHIRVYNPYESVIEIRHTYGRVRSHV